MKVTILNQKSKVIEKVLNREDFVGFHKKYGDIAGFSLHIAIFEYFFKIDISCYSLKELWVNNGVDNPGFTTNLTLKIRPEDLNKVRELKLNEIL